MCILDEIRAKREEIYAIARAHKAEKLWVFGSCARKEETPESDVVFLVKWAIELIIEVGADMSRDQLHKSSPIFTN